MAEYIVPRKVIALVRENPLGLLALMKENEGLACPLQIITDSARVVAFDSDDIQERYTPSKHNVRCYALQGDPVCYEDRASVRGLKIHQPQVDSKEHCPVYQAVIEELRKLT
ncbi:MAG: hypothetical protein ABIH82_02720 [Candidatus Woesearchaeota archaeon]